MSRTRKIGAQGIFTLAIASALSFGAAQAFAGPEPTARETCSGLCDQECREAGYAGGYCPTNEPCTCYEL